MSFLPQKSASTNTAPETLKITLYSTFSFEISHIRFSCVHTGFFFLPTPNTELSTYVQKHKLHNEFFDSGPLATYMGVDFARSSNSAHKHYTFLKLRYSSDPATCGSPNEHGHAILETVAGNLHICSNHKLVHSPLPLFPHLQEMPVGRWLLMPTTCQQTPLCPALQQLPAPGKLCC